MTFTMRETAGDNHLVVVRGTDRYGVTGVTTLDSSQWDEIKAHTKFRTDTKRFNEVSAAFFAPLQEAMDEMKRSNTVVPDPIGYVVDDEPVEGVVGNPGHMFKLNDDSVVLRLLEQGSFDRLEWVGDKLVATKQDQPAAAAQPSAAEVGAEATGLPLDEV